MKLMQLMSMILAVCGVLSVNVIGGTIDVPGDFASIQEAVDASSDGDEIIVAPGTYTSAQDGHVVDMKGKAVTLRSSDGPEVTIIDGQQARRGIAMFNDEDEGTVISGFTITNGYASPYDYDDDGDVIEFGSEFGGGVFHKSFSSVLAPRIENCIITGNSGMAGGGVSLSGGGGVLLDCVIENNLATGDSWLTGRGGGVYFTGAAANMNGTTVRNNTAFVGGGVYMNMGDLHMRACQVIDNTSEYTGGGVAVFDAYPVLRFTTISNNQAGNNGGGVLIDGDNQSIVDLLDCTIEGNSSDRAGGGVYCNYYSKVDIFRCRIADNMAQWGGGLYVADDDYMWFGSATVCSSFFCNNSPNHVSGNYSDGSCGSSHQDNQFLEQCLSSCCLSFECLEDVEQNWCEDQGGYWSHLLDCESAQPCGIPTGACCVEGFGCFEDWNESTCGFFDGIWGIGLTCEELNCTEGACCYTDTWCEIEVQPYCEINGGAYLGQGTLCEDFDCASLQTACCFGYECQSLTEDECNTQGGYVRGFNISCDDVICEPPGACCFQTDCEILFEDECLEQGGLFQGTESSCDDLWTCRVVSCCVDSSEYCQDYTAEYCASINGEPGDSSCVDWDPCVTRGACCMGGYGICYDWSTQDDCESLWGYWLPDSECEWAPCMRGNCCVEGECMQLFYEDCMAWGGEYTGPILEGCNDPMFYCSNTIVVDASGGGDYLTIQEGIDAANDTDTVLVRAGTYTGSGDASVPVVDLKGKAIRLAGDPKRAGKVYIDGQGQRACIICDSGETPATVIDLIECINGSALEGGALYCLSNPTITNCAFRDSTAQDAGGGVYIKESQPTFIGCEFTGNESPYGGAIYMIDSSPVITEGLIAQNSASNRGGGLRMYRSSPVLTNVTIEGNWASRGGAAHIQTNSVPVLESCMILNNTADSLGGGLVTNTNSPAIYRQCTFMGNRATGDNGGQGSGGAIYSDSSACVVENCLIEGNTADTYGGGIYCWYSSPVVTGTTIKGNTSSASGGAIRTIGGSGPSLDNAILCGNSPDNIGGPWDGAGDNCLTDNCQDNNGNDMPDDCEDLYCEGDANDDYVVDINDLLAILDSWGGSGGDVTGDGETTIDDILVVLGNWGACL